MLVKHVNTTTGTTSGFDLKPALTGPFRCPVLYLLCLLYTMVFGLKGTEVRFYPPY